MLNHTPVLDHVYSALADPTRRAMIERLSRGSASVSELAQPMKMSLAAVVQHLQVLTTSGVVQTRKIGRVRHCELRPEVLKHASSWLISQQQAFWKAGMREIDQLLVEESSPHNSKKGKS